MRGLRGDGPGWGCQAWNGPGSAPVSQAEDQSYGRRLTGFFFGLEPNMRSSRHWGVIEGMLSSMRTTSARVTSNLQFASAQCRCPRAPRERWVDETRTGVPQIVA